MTALLASRWARACADVRENWPAMLCGVVMALAVTPLLMSVSDTSAMNTFAAIAGDSLGFYGCIWIVTRKNKFPDGERRGWRTIVYMFKRYWLAEIVDNLLRAAILTGVGWFMVAGLATTLVGNLLADVVFFGIAAFTGEAFTDWCVKMVRTLPALRLRFQASGYVRLRLVATLVTVVLLGLTAIEPAKHGPVISTVEVTWGYIVPVLRTDIVFVP